MNHFFKKQFAALLLVLAVSSSLCLSLYYFDNKYKHPGTQGMEGILSLSEQEIRQHSLHFLIHGWSFYPNTLLTPEDLKTAENTPYMIYTSIGEHTRFQRGIRPHGCGTYVLTLILPQTPRHYALELPEIYSSYNLYLNDDLVLQVGNPDPDAYSPKTQNRMVTFEAGGTVTILIAVSDYSHFYSGVVYPPAFGFPLTLNLMRGARLGLTLCLSLTGVLAAALACYMGIRMRHKNSLLFSLLCLTAASFTGYPLLHTAFSLSIQPWYALEIFGSYAMTFLVILLQNRICHVNRPMCRISASASAAFCFLALCYGLFSAYLTIPVMKGFSLLSTIYKLSAALYLMLISFHALYTEQLRSPLLFYSSIFYGTLLIWDRLLSAYEPIITGWFSEWGSLILIFCIGTFLWHELASAYAYSAMLAENHRQMQRQLAMQMEYTEQLKKRAEETQRLIHDFRQHLRTITEMTLQIKSQPDTSAMQQDLLDYLQALPKMNSLQKTNVPYSLCNHAAIDALLQYYNSAAVRQKIHTRLSLSLPEGIPLSDIEWCSILGNLLENALEACQRQSSKDPTIAVYSRETAHTLFLKIENSYDGYYFRSENRFLSRKSHNLRYGIGLESVKDIISFHGGTLDIHPDATIFSVRITLPIPESSFESDTQSLR